MGDVPRVRVELAARFEPDEIAPILAVDEQDQLAGDEMCTPARIYRPDFFAALRWARAASVSAFLTPCGLRASWTTTTRLLRRQDSISA